MPGFRGVDNIKSTVKYVKAYGGIVDCAVCYTTDPRFGLLERLKASLKGAAPPGKVFTNTYFLNKAREMEALGADMITLKDMSGLIRPSATGNANRPDRRRAGRELRH